ncbi:YheC/YheD family protein [Alicyclobacillus tolerans]|uniref:YheC/YheD family protein n=1 Tax=Alicyclobacillus tolerans TaxID=90970 RepID=UPI003B815341
MKAKMTSWSTGNATLGVYLEKTGNSKRPFGEQTQLVLDLIEIGRERDVEVYILYPGCVTAQTALYCERLRPALFKEVAMPNFSVVLRRSGFFHRSRFVLAKRELQKLREDQCLHTLLVEESDKWTLVHLLQQDKQTAQLLPETECVSSAREAWAALTHFSKAYLKPRRSAQGLGVFRCQWKNRQLFLTWDERTSTPSLRQVSFPGHQDLAYGKWLKFWSSYKFQDALVQEAIPLLEWRGGPVDFRWLMIQSSAGPQVVARVARRGEGGQVTTNLHSGARAFPAEQVIRESFTKSERVLEEIDKAALLVFEMFQKQSGPFAELGVDFALSNHGKLYVLEVNPTPGRRMLRALDKHTRQLSLVKLIEYVKEVNDETGGLHQSASTQTNSK